MTTRQPAPLAQPFIQLPATGRQPGDIHAFVDSPQGSRHKYKDESL